MNLDQMWAALERYQPYAERRGFGAEWKRMTTKRTEKAARKASGAAADAAWSTKGWSKSMADASSAAGWAAAEASPDRAERSIRFITRAIELENEQ